MRGMIEESLLNVEAWVEKNEYRGYEPFDGLNSYLRPLAFGNLFAERILQQLVRQSPINLRPLLGIGRNESTKGRGYMAWGYLTMLKHTGNREYSAKAARCLDWLIENKSPNYKEYSWGNHFRFSSRVGSIPRLEPIVPWSSLIGQAFLDGYEILGRKEYLEVAKSICNWICGLPRKQTDSGICIAYNALGQTTVHGASMLGAALLARTARFTGDDSAVQLARDAMEYSCTRQNPDGSWYYAEEDNSRWIDNFHTGYNLDSLKCYIDNTGDRTYEGNLRRGFAYFRNNFFEETGRPKYYHDRTYPVDIQAASQAIDTLAYFSELDETSLELSTKVACWTIVNMQDKRGYFYYRQLPYIRVKTPMLHWGQATMYKSLSLLLSRL